jgi:tRNA(adenine34) deaminase
MSLALEEAKAAYRMKEVPVGAVIVRDGRVIGRGRNSVERTKDPTAHAEILAIGAACDSIGKKFLEDCTLYVTLESCHMCAGAIVLSRLKRVVFGVEDKKAGALISLARVADDQRLNHSAEISWGVLREDCSRLLKKFFAELRSADTDRVG